MYITLNYGGEKMSLGLRKFDLGRQNCDILG